MQTKTVFIDGGAGTTGLRIADRLSGRSDITLLTLPEEKRKDEAARRELLNSADFSFLCLPDDAARAAVAMVEAPNAVIIDASTAHRTSPAFAYGFPELSPAFRAAVQGGHRIAVPGCHAGGFIACVAPLVEAGILKKDARLSFHSITGYSGGGKKMIADYEAGDRSPLLAYPRPYALSQSHKHLPEINYVTGLELPPVFSPIVADFYSGMLVTVPLHRSEICGSIDDIRAVYRALYCGPIVSYKENVDEAGFLSAGALSGSDRMEISVFGNGDRVTLCARYDNLGKGASGAAIQCMNIVMGQSETYGLEV